MKKTVLYGLIFPISFVSGQFAIAEIESVNPDVTKTDVAKPDVIKSDVTKEVKMNNSSWIGVWIEKLPIALSKHLSSTLKQDQGLIIRKVASDSPADKAGLLPYDIISKINDKNVYSERQLVEIIRKTQPGTKVKLDIIRQGKLLSQEATVEASPHQKSSASDLFPYSPRSRHHQGMGMRPLSPPHWMNDPFFKRGFNHQFNRMQQQLNQLHQQQQQLHLYQQQQLKQQNNWSQFESIQIESTGDDKQRAVVKYEDSNGNKKEFVFEGNRNEVRQQIKAQAEMDEGKKQSLLRALDMNNNPPLPFGYNGFRGPDWFQYHH